MNRTSQKAYCDVASTHSRRLNICKKWMNTSFICHTSTNIQNQNIMAFISNGIYKSSGFKAWVSHHLNLRLDSSYYTIYAIRCFIMKPNAVKQTHWKCKNHVWKYSYILCSNEALLAISKFDTLTSTAYSYSIAYLLHVINLCDKRSAIITQQK